MKTITIVCFGLLLSILQAHAQKTSLQELLRNAVKPNQPYKWNRGGALAKIQDRLKKLSKDEQLHVAKTLGLALDSKSWRTYENDSLNRGRIIEIIESVKDPQLIPILLQVFNSSYEYGYNQSRVLLILSKFYQSRSIKTKLVRGQHSLALVKSLAKANIHNQDQADRLIEMALVDLNGFKDLRVLLQVVYEGMIRPDNKLQRKILLCAIQIAKNLQENTNKLKQDPVLFERTLKMVKIVLNWLNQDDVSPRNRHNRFWLTENERLALKASYLLTLAVSGDTTPSGFNGHNQIVIKLSHFNKGKLEDGFLRGEPDLYIYATISPAYNVYDSNMPVPEECRAIEAPVLWTSKTHEVGDSYTETEEIRISVKKINELLSEAYQGQCASQMGYLINFQLYEAETGSDTELGHINVDLHRLKHNEAFTKEIIDGDKSDPEGPETIVGSQASVKVTIVVEP